jgi:hypothetical protein
MQMGIVLFLALCLLWFAFRKRRSAVIVFSLLMGFLLGPLSAGIFFMFLGTWLALRAYRLQKYGVASFNAANRIARENSIAKREGRAPRPVEEVLGESTATIRERANKARASKGVVTTSTRPSASSRYTPKKTKRAKKN